MKKFLFLTAAVIFSAASAYAHCSACGTDAPHAKAPEAKSSCSAEKASCSTAAKASCCGTCGGTCSTASTKSSCGSTSATATATKDCGSSCGGKAKAKAEPAVATQPPSCCPASKAQPAVAKSDA